MYTSNLLPIIITTLSLITASSCGSIQISNTIPGKGVACWLTISDICGCSGTSKLDDHRCAELKSYEHGRQSFKVVKSDRSGYCASGLTVNFDDSASTVYPIFNVILVSQCGQKGVQFRGKGANVNRERSLNLETTAEASSTTAKIIDSS
ncbi:hypothetical protein G7Y89_g3019 [Cudoniella acicularis]|uniref:Uncharacterized protein n=1 Tax=Cudoniella acicularis TaxID=354080 RepID=A0A8H4RV75_9HELO|nr:hypothetical protein G7Y89_g3019 [Cudoniella acicularis]